MSHNYKSKFALDEKVIVDGCSSIIATVTGICFRDHLCELEISWWNSGSLCTAWVPERRLSYPSD